MIKGVVFDLDGTLVDSKLNFNQIKRELEIPLNHTILEHIASMPERKKAEKIEQLKAIEKKAAVKSMPFKNARIVLEVLTKQEIKTAIFTRNHREPVDIFCEGIAYQFDIVLTRDDCAPKPNPEGLEIIRKTWQLAKREMIFIGDHKIDGDTGNKAGIETWIVDHTGEQNRLSRARGSVAGKLYCLDEIIERLGLEAMTVDY